LIYPYIIFTSDSSRKNLAKPCYLCYFLLSYHSRRPPCEEGMFCLCVHSGSARITCFRGVPSVGGQSKVKEFYECPCVVPAEVPEQLAAVKTDESRVSVGDKPATATRTLCPSRNKRINTAGEKRVSVSRLHCHHRQVYQRSHLSRVAYAHSRDRMAKSVVTVRSKRRSPLIFPPAMYNALGGFVGRTVRFQEI